MNVYKWSQPESSQGFWSYQPTWRREASGLRFVDLSECRSLTAPTVAGTALRCLRQCLPLEEFDIYICESFGVLANGDPEVSPTVKVEHPELEIAWLMHCPQLTGQVWMNGDPNVLGIYMNL